MNAQTRTAAAASDAQQQPTLNHAVALAAASPTQTTAPASALVTAPPAPQLNAQLGSPEWQQALNQQVLMFHRNGQQSAELRLHPQELGALQITLKLDDQQAQLHIASAHGQVRAAGGSGDAAAAARAGGERYQPGAEQRGRRVHPALAAGATAGFQRPGPFQLC
ncbi:flagellar hook-length control protein FliK [Serratia marcescens]|uniref:flagellar hook-length control protein FliK n=1 Tax=Serratia marcescens TaxID=615 RepID=UPI003C7B0656